jgi:hypothetical protein
MLKPTNQPEEEIILELLHQQTLAADRVEDLKEERPEQLLRGNRGSAGLRIQRGEPPRELPQHLVGHVPDRPQRMGGRNPLLGRDVAEHPRLLLIRPPHPSPSSRDGLRRPHRFYSTGEPDASFSAAC